MKSSTRLILVGVLAAATLAACKKPEVPAPKPAEPKAEAASPADAGPGTTTNFENPPPKP